MILKNIPNRSTNDINCGGALELRFGSRGGLDLPFGALWVPCGPTVPPSRLLEDFGFIWGVILNPKSVKFGVDFRCVFGMLFGRVLEWFWGCFG